nr:hypothetical protein 1634Bnrm3_p154 [Cryptomonas sp.]
MIIEWIFRKISFSKKYEITIFNNLSDSNISHRILKKLQFKKKLFKNMKKSECAKYQEFFKDFSITVDKKIYSNCLKKKIPENLKKKLVCNINKMQNKFNFNILYHPVFNNNMNKSLYYQKLTNFNVKYLCQEKHCQLLFYKIKKSTPLFLCKCCTFVTSIKKNTVNKKHSF